MRITILRPVVRHEVPCIRAVMKDTALGLSQQSVEAEGSRAQEVLCPAGSSPDNGGMGLVLPDNPGPSSEVERRNESEPVVEPPLSRSRLQPGGYGPVSGACLPHGGDGNSDVGSWCRLRGHGEGLRRSRGDVAGEKLGAHPTERCAGNMGTICELPKPATSQVADGRSTVD